MDVHNVTQRAVIYVLLTLLTASCVEIKLFKEQKSVTGGLAVLTLVNPSKITLASRSSIRLVSHITVIV